jgi:periplasmic protein TonB
MSIIRGLRYPTALAFGLLLTGTLFWSLWSFTNVPFQLQTVESVPIEFSRTRLDTPPEQRSRETEVIPPPDIPDTRIPRIVTSVVGVEPVVERRTVEKPDIGKPGIGFAGDRDAMPLVRIEPEYPRRAIVQEIEGWVKVQFTVTGTGAVTDVVVIENSPSNIFDDAAVRAVSRWRYNPKVEGTVAVERVGMQTVLRFDLEE